MKDKKEIFVKKEVQTWVFKLWQEKAFENFSETKTF